MFQTPIDLTNLSTLPLLVVLVSVAVVVAMAVIGVQRHRAGLLLSHELTAEAAREPAVRTVGARRDRILKRAA